MNRHHRRFERQLDRMGRSLPGVGGPLRGLAAPGRFWIRLPVAILLIIGGFLGFLPVLGFWMIPMGLILLAVDLPGLRPRVSALLIRGRALWRRFRRR
ncbi:hypothetical protein [Pararhodobacter sp.]|uniref:hypothetical protein n=1 Tax=Pararhodobacter sp. TaxID=2127056 RepID=UPI002AFE960B|nr:hypothetical protein [Pararhodobacter sp.]